MYIIHFRLFAGQLTIDTIGGDFVPLNSPVTIFFTLDGELSKHTILKDFSRNIKANKIEWIYPYDKVNEEWIIDLSRLRLAFKFLNKEEYLNGKITVEPTFEKKQRTDELTETEYVYETRLQIKIDPTEMFIFSPSYDVEYTIDIKESLIKFKKDYPDNIKCGFLMMKYEDTKLQSKVISKLRDLFARNELFLLRADDKHYSDDLLSNIRTYMHGCYFGVALFDRLNTEYFNPNVSLEIGYMMALRKPILFLKDRTLKSLHTDLVGKLYEEFDFQNFTKAFDLAIIKWLKHHELI